MSLAAETRAAARAHPFLLDAMRAGICNYTAAARFLDVGDEAAVAAALRRLAGDLEDYDDPADARLQVRMERGFGEGATADAVLTVGDLALVPDAGEVTVVFVRGDLTVGRFAAMLGRLDAADVAVRAAGTTDSLAVVAVPSADGPAALRAIDDPGT